MKVEYVYNEKGEKTSVILPIELWSKVSPLIEKKREERVLDLSEYKGIYKNMKNLDSEIKKLREEWIRG
ncbi:MAG: hypothetical protein U9O96_07990 [Candidatus Thermoplasmatota archaeon]|nr:hypothetical protein [Candidatus Thermoplasmatota archaeon]